MEMDDYEADGLIPMALDDSEEGEQEMEYDSEEGEMEMMELAEGESDSETNS
jgi:hypothetical protein